MVFGTTRTKAKIDDCSRVSGAHLTAAGPVHERAVRAERGSVGGVPPVARPCEVSAFAADAGDAADQDAAGWDGVAGGSTPRLICNNRFAVMTASSRCHDKK
jgi:hypothetical protein